MWNNKDNFRFLVSRRGLLQTAAGLVGGATLPAEMSVALAEHHPALGTYPVGSSGSSVFVGVTPPLTGTYALQGEDELKGVRPVIIVKGKLEKEMKGKEDYYDVVEIVPGEGLMQKPDAFGCSLGGYT